MGVDLDGRPESQHLHLVQQQRLGFEVDVVLEADPSGLDLLDLVSGHLRRGRQARDGQLQLLHLLQQSGFHLVPAEGEVRVKREKTEDKNDWGGERGRMVGEMRIRRISISLIVGIRKVKLFGLYSKYVHRRMIEEVTTK